MREFKTAAEFAEEGVSRGRVRTMQRRGEWNYAERGLWARGSEPVGVVDLSVGRAWQKNGVVSGRPAGVLHGFDGVNLAEPEVIVSTKQSGRGSRTRRRDVDIDRIDVIDGVCITNPLQTLLDLAAELTDDIWEQALESALRQRLVTINEVEAAMVPGARGVRTIRRVLSRRPAGAPPTESILETLMIQLVRDAGLPEPTRQVQVFGDNGRPVARVDLAWPDLGVFVELDGEHHEGQPLHDANRQTNVVAATGWLCARFTWTEVTRAPKDAARRLRRVLEHARRRALSA